MNPSPYYTPSTTHPPAYQLRYTWTGWPAKTYMFPRPPADEIWSRLRSEWEEDGIRLLETSWRRESICLSLSTKPTVSPILLAERVKGRLDYACRTRRDRLRFSRKLAVRSMGDVRYEQVLEYIGSQIDNRRFANRTYSEYLKQFTVRDPTVDLRRPTRTKSGAYWYDLHLVILVDRRYGQLGSMDLRRVRDGSFRIARRKGHLLSAVAVVPDHIHMAIRGLLQMSPEELALSYLNDLAQVTGTRSIWQPGYYVGTFGVYNMNAIRPRFKCAASRE